MLRAAAEGWREKCGIRVFCTSVRIGRLLLLRGLCNRSLSGCRYKQQNRGGGVGGALDSRTLNPKP